MTSPPAGGEGGADVRAAHDAVARKPAAEAARAEAATWAWLAEAELPEGSEAAVVRFFDPATDLDGRAAEWGHRFAGHSFRDLARFAAGLAATEADAWEADEPHVATRAIEERRFLAGDRILHWAVPWLDAVGTASAAAAAATLLDLGDRLRPAPLLAAGEGTVLPGHDEIGPLDPGVPLGELLRSLWSGLVVFDEPGPDAATRFDAAADRWRAVAAAHAGTAALWEALARRAGTTAARLRAPQ